MGGGAFNAPWKLIQVAQQTVSGSFVLAFTAPVKKGDLLICVLGYEDSGPNPVMSDTAGNAWSVPIVVSTIPGHQFFTALSFAVANASGPLAVTAAGIAAPFAGMDLFEYSGNRKVNPMDTFSIISQAGPSATMTATPINVSKNRELIFAAISGNSNNAQPQLPLIPIPGFGGNQFASAISTRAKGPFTAVALQAPAALYNAIVIAFFGLNS